MANYNLDWDDLGRSIEDIVDRAVNSHDYQKLNQTVRQAVDRAVDLGSEAVRKVVDSSSRPASGTASQRPVVEEKKDLPVLYGSTGGKTTSGILRIVGGGLLSGVTLMGSLATMAMDFMFGVPGGGIGGWFAMVCLAGGVGLIWSGANTLGKVKRYKAYKKALGQKTYCALDKLSRSVGKSVKYVRKEVLKMIDEGLFLQGHMDKEETILITSDETYYRFEQSRLQLEERKRQENADKKAQEAAARKRQETAAQDSRVKEVLDRGNAFIAQIRKCNDDIPGEEISAKIDRMERIVRQIFERAEAHPEIVPDLKKMMDYYLPMTVKLLNAYAEMDAQPVQGETILNSKREIEQTLDTLNLAFEKLLDDLFRDTAMDVSSDISVLNTLLAQEGLSEDEFARMKKQQNI